MGRVDGHVITSFRIGMIPRGPTILDGETTAGRGGMTAREVNKNIVIIGYCDKFPYCNSFNKDTLNYTGRSDRPKILGAISERSISMQFGPNPV